MARKSLEELRSQFKKDDKQTSRPNNYYPFWNMKEGEQCIIRFLPDLDDDNPLGFMVEKLTHTLTINGERKNVPCMKMYDPDPKACPICNVSQGYYKDDDKANGKLYWRKKQHIVQALIVEDPLPKDSDTGETHEGKVRAISLGYQLFEIIKAAFEGGELDEIPYAYEGGCNFVIKKSKQGDYATYAVGSNFARKATDLTEDEIAVATDSMVELGSLLPPNPGLEKLEGMLEAALTGGEYNDSKEDAPSTMSFKKKATPAKTDDEAPAKTEAKKEEAPAKEAADSSEAADAILAKIRNRNKK